MAVVLVSILPVLLQALRRLVVEGIGVARVKALRQAVVRGLRLLNLLQDSIRLGASLLFDVYLPHLLYSLQLISQLLVGEAQLTVVDILLLNCLCW